MKTAVLPVAVYKLATEVTVTLRVPVAVSTFCLVAIALAVRAPAGMMMVPSWVPEVPPTVAPVQVVVALAPVVMALTVENDTVIAELVSVVVRVNVNVIWQVVAPAAVEALHGALATDAVVDPLTATPTRISVQVVGKPAEGAWPALHTTQLPGVLPVFRHFLQPDPQERQVPASRKYVSAHWVATDALEQETTPAPVHWTHCPKAVRA